MSEDKVFRRKIGIKIGIIILQLFICISFLKGTIENFHNELTWKDDYSRIPLYESYITDGEYNKLRQAMLLYNSNNEILDSYWEIANAYQYLSDYKVWNTASKELEENKQEYEVLKSVSKQELLVISENSTFEKNRLILANFVKQVESD